MTYTVTCTVYSVFGSEKIADAYGDFDTIVQARRFAFKELNKKRFVKNYAIFSVSGSMRGFVKYNYKIKDFVYVSVPSDKQYYFLSDGIVDKYREIISKNKENFTHWM